MRQTYYLLNALQSSTSYRQSPLRVFVSLYRIFKTTILLNLLCFPCFSAGPIASGSSRILWGLGKHDAVAVAGLGKSSDWDELENINGKRENVRIAAAGKFYNTTTIVVCDGN